MDSSIGKADEGSKSASTGKPSSALPKQGGLPAPKSALPGHKSVSNSLPPCKPSLKSLSPTSVDFSASAKSKSITAFSGAGGSVKTCDDSTGGKVASDCGGGAISHSTALPKQGGLPTPKSMLPGHKSVSSSLPPTKPPLKSLAPATGDLSASGKTDKSKSITGFGGGGFPKASDDSSATTTAKVGPDFGASTLHSTALPKQGSLPAPKSMLPGFKPPPSSFQPKHQSLAPKSPPSFASDSVGASSKPAIDSASGGVSGGGGGGGVGGVGVGGGVGGVGVGGGGGGVGVGGGGVGSTSGAFAFLPISGATSTATKPSISGGGGGASGASHDLFPPSIPAKSTRPMSMLPPSAPKGGEYSSLSSSSKPTSGLPAPSPRPSSLPSANPSSRSLPPALAGAGAALRSSSKSGTVGDSASLPPPSCATDAGGSALPAPGGLKAQKSKLSGAPPRKEMSISERAASHTQGSSLNANADDNGLSTTSLIYKAPSDVPRRNRAPTSKQAKTSKGARVSRGARPLLSVKPKPSLSKSKSQARHAISAGGGSSGGGAAAPAGPGTFTSGASSSGVSSGSGGGGGGGGKSSSPHSAKPSSAKEDKTPKAPASAAGGGEGVAPSDAGKTGGHNLSIPIADCFAFCSNFDLKAMDDVLKVIEDDVDGNSTYWAIHVLTIAVILVANLYHGRI